MTATAIKKIPTITATSTPNFYDVLSSDGFTHYPMLITGPGCVRCGCPAGEAGRNCYHRNYALANMIYIDPVITMRLAQLEQDLIEWNSKQNFIEEEAELDEVRDLFGEAA
jgi:hypothetical protein